MPYTAVLIKIFKLTDITIIVMVLITLDGGISISRIGILGIRAPFLVRPHAIKNSCGLLLKSIVSHLCHFGHFISAKSQIVVIFIRHRYNNFLRKVGF